MPDFKINDEGKLLGDDGKLLLIEGKEVTITGAKSQSEIDHAFQVEKAKHKGLQDTLTERIKTLESQAEKSEETKRLLAELREEKTGLDAKLLDAERNAESKVATQLTRATEGQKLAETALAEERTGRLRDQVSNIVLGAAMGKFNDPATDVVPHLLGFHARESVKDSEGKDTEKVLDTFKMTFENEKGEKVTENLDIGRALEVWGLQHPHHVKASNVSGSGGGTFVNTANLKRSEMTAAEKAAFVGKNGTDAFKALPE